MVENVLLFINDIIRLEQLEEIVMKIRHESKLIKIITYNVL